jgi:hypothetical protein
VRGQETLEGQKSPVVTGSSMGHLKPAHKVPDILSRRWGNDR